MRLSLLLLVALSASCALRPRYKDFVTAKTEGKQVQVLVTDANGAPLPNVKVEMSELKNRVTFTSAADGTFALPVEKKYLDENPVLVLQLPPGSNAYALALAPPPLPELKPAPAEPSVPPPPQSPEAPPLPVPAPTTPAPATGGTTP